MTTRVRIRPAGEGYYLGTLAIGCDFVTSGVGDTDGDGVITVGAFGESQADALHKAALIAERIVDDPVLNAVLPPQAKAAIVATKKLASAAKRGRSALRGVMRRLRGPGKRRLAKTLAKEQRKRPHPPPRIPEPAYDDEYDDAPDEETPQESTAVAPVEPSQPVEESSDDEGDESEGGDE